MKVTKAKFKKGPVECSDYGLGYIISIDTTGLYPIQVRFQAQDSDSSPVSYTLDGASVIGAAPTLKRSKHDWEP